MQSGDGRAEFSTDPEPAQADPGSAARKRRRGPRGLGRGLARILVDAADPASVDRASVGLAGLVGRRPASMWSPELDRSVADAGLRALVAAFGLEALAVAAAPRSGDGGDALVVRSALPGGWSSDIGPGGLLHRHLRRLVSPGRLSIVRRAGSARQLRADDRWLWSFQTVLEDQAVAAAGIGADRLTPELDQALRLAGQTLAFSVADRGVDQRRRQEIADGTRVLLKSEGEDVLAEVNADWPLDRPVKPGLRSRRTGVGRGPEPVLAVARAAAKAARPRCGVLYAQTAEIDGHGLTLALVKRESQGLCLGWADHPVGDLSGVAEAVFIAAL